MVVAGATHDVSNQSPAVWRDLVLGFLAKHPS